MHYELTDETIIVDGRVLRRIRATEDLPWFGIKNGDLGGFIERGNNLTCDASVFGKAQTLDTTRVYGNARVEGVVDVFGDVGA